MEVNYLDLVGEGYMGSMQWQLGREMGTIPVFASRTQENQENLGRDVKIPKISVKHNYLSKTFIYQLMHNRVALKEYSNLH